MPMAEAVNSRIRVGYILYRVSVIIYYVPEFGPGQMV